MQPNPEYSASNTTGPTRPRLRGIPGGYDLDRWPIFVKLNDNETLVSWWARLAHQYGITPAGLFRELLMRPRSYAPNLIEQRLARPERSVSERTGVQHSERKLAFQRHQRILSLHNDLLRRFETFPPLPRLKGTQFCPKCLRDHQVWRPEWRNPLVLVCPEHRDLLLQTCPNCNLAPFRSIAWARRDRPPTNCTEYLGVPNAQNRRHRTRCGTDLSRLIGKPAGTDLVHATELFHSALLHTTTTRDFAGKNISTQQAARALLLLTYESLHTPQGRRLPADASRTAEALVNAYTVLRQPSFGEASAMADKLNLLQVHGRVTPIGPAPIIRARPLEPLLHAIRLESLHDKLPPTTQLAFRIGSDWPRVPRSLRHRYTYVPANVPTWNSSPVPLAAIPQLWWPHALPGFNLMNDARAQFAISIAIACVGRSITVASAAELLGAPKAASAKITSTWRRIAQSSSWPELRTAILTAADSVTHDPPSIDYEARRQALTTPDQIDTFIRSRKPEIDFSDAEKLWLLCHFTGGDPRLSPKEWGDLRAPNIAPRTPNRKTMQMILVSLAHQKGEPDTWQPP